MKTIVFGVDDSPEARAAVRIAAAFARGRGGRVEVTHRKRKEALGAGEAPTRLSSAGSTALDEAPVIAALDGTAASRVVVDTAVRLAGELGAPVVFVYVRGGPAGFWGDPFYQRRLTVEMTRARRALDAALAVAERAGVDAESEILEGKPRRRILEFAGDRGAQLVVVGSRGRRFGRSVSTGVIRASERPVVVARRRAAPVKTCAAAA